MWARAALAALLLLAGSAGLAHAQSVLTPPSSTTAYVANNLIASSATAGLIVNPSVTLANSKGQSAITRVRLFVADAASGWGSSLVQIDLWSASPTFTNGDHGAFAVVTGMASHVGSFVVALANGGDGSSGEGAVTPGNIALAGGQGTVKLYWTAKFLSTTSGTITASHNLTLSAEVLN